MPRSYDDRAYPQGPQISPHPIVGGRVTPKNPLRGRKRVGPIGAIVPGDDVEVARELARLRMGRGGKLRRLEEFPIKVISDAGTLTTGDGKFIFVASKEMEGWELVWAQAYITTVSSSGDVEIMLRDVGNAVDLLDEYLTIDEGDFHSSTSAQQMEITGGTVVVNERTRYAIDVDTAGTGAKGLGVCLFFLPRKK